MFRTFLKIFAIILVIGAVIFFVFVPSYIDKSKNKVTLKIENPAKVDWYDSIPFIADLHCDALLWDRNNLKNHSYGHVDIPRMKQANMAFQVFTIVSKTPKGINIESNDDKSDQIALLSFAQLRNPGDWFSVKTRALHQCEELFKTARQSKGEFRVITNQAELGSGQF